MPTKIGVLIVILLVVAGGFFYMQNPSPEIPDSSVGEVNLGTGEAEFIDSEGNVATTTVIVSSGGLPKPVPPLSRPFVVPSIYTGNAKKLMEEKNVAAVARLKADPSDSAAWINLGVIRKVAEDYEGAREAWEYSVRLNPKASVPHSNLADLYMSYLKNYPKAEAEWKAVIALDSQNTLAYRGLFELYSLYDTAKAAQAPGVLLSGLKATPKNIDLLIPLAQYYKQKGNTAEARTYFTEAQTEAKARGNTELVKMLQEELNNL